MKNKPIDFQIMRINKNAQKICRCKPPQYEIDTTNKLVQCTKCNAYIHPFDALVGLSENIEWYNEEKIRLNEERNELIDKRNNLAKEVNSLSIKRFRMNSFRDLQNNYMKDMMPNCPHCGRAFDPTEVNHYTNKNYCDYKKKRTREEKIAIIHSYRKPSLEEFNKVWEELESYTDEEINKEFDRIERIRDFI